ncbi:MAG: DUF2993 domain-containing protein [Leptolyngbya sp. SIO4C1]|nr:DUF2993 domain-containing protein [Leptolyngbya sp. SIO4C1]
MTSQLPDSPQRPSARGSRLIGRVLPMAVRLWLQTQVDQIEGLTFAIDGTDRQLLSGHIPAVSVAAQQAVYRGIYLSQVALAADEVRINLGQVIRGKPLRLLQAFPVAGEVWLTEQDLNKSLQSALLSEGIAAFWQALLTMPTVSQELAECYGRAADRLPAARSQVTIGQGRLTLSLQSAAAVDDYIAVLQAAVETQAERCLVLRQPQWLSHPQAGSGCPSQALEGFQWDLGSQTRLHRLSVEAGGLRCQGEVMVNP